MVSSSPAAANGDFSNFDGYALWVKNLDDGPVSVSVSINAGFTGQSGIPGNDPRNDGFQICSDGNPEVAILAANLGREPLSGSLKLSGTELGLGRGKVRVTRLRAEHGPEITDVTLAVALPANAIRFYLLEEP